MDNGPKDHFTARHYAAKDSRGPLPFLNPTRRHIPLSLADVKPAPTAEKQTADETLGKTTTDSVYHVWHSRDNRKGRHAISVTADYAGKSSLRSSSSLVETLKGMAKMFVRYPIWDVSYDVALIYTIGSIVWCINGFFVWYPLYRPETEFPGEVDSGGGISALVGATIFEVGATLAMLEAVNENRTDCFGWALEKAVEDGLVVAKRHPECRHHHGNRRSLFGRPRRLANGERGRTGDKGDHEASTSPDGTEKDSEGSDPRDKRVWSWWPSWYELRTHYFREIGFLACFSQIIGATIFWISGIVGVPSILGGLSTPAENGIYWVPQVIGGSGFIISSFLFMLETQEKWYRPALGVLGWHIGFWNLVGGIGFCLCGALGFGAANPAVEYASTLATFIGSWAFLVSHCPLLP
ncbi:hypothetical protein CONLIGDRAFT_385561 [Coniochaeta ligniaria NRRL 30616]|uniref:Integral membrane protein n=1 Tax=Coniochaeta ligniaria NRRL 30616 TaxID=1408157 RepID=A0A1J7IM56_9PEZI|nr:hypothetical protein CONLIGDRAFT_385561 [Coniochaeta ligniaria NRRL 30616]